MGRKPNIFIDGTTKGALIALILSVSYLLYLIALYDVVLLPLAGLELFAIPIAFLYGIIPAILLGATAGTLIAILYSSSTPKSVNQSAWLGALVPIVILVLTVGFLYTRSDLKQSEFEYALRIYSFFYWIPAVLFVLSGIHFTKRYFLEAKQLDANLIKVSHRRQLSWLFLPPLAVIVFVNLVRLLPLVLTSKETRQYNVTWNKDSHSTCDSYVSLYFTDYPGYGISTCSQGLASTLMQGGEQEVLLVMSEERDFFSWRYTVQSVGGWTSDVSTWDGLFLVCSSVNVRNQFVQDPQCGEHFPLKEPYKILPSEMFK